MAKLINCFVVVLAAASLFLSCSAWGAETNCRYFHCGNGELNLATNKGKMKFKGRYRNPDGTYDKAALAQINRVFLARYGNPISEISPRLIEFIDSIQDKFNPGGRVTITSGYRNPEYNTGLRKSGKLAAKASLHQYGMASDFWVAGVSSEKIWHYVRELGFGGVGFYHGKNVHVDVGPARFWDETSSKVGTDISDDNKLIGIVTDKDIYRPGDQIEMRFIRMTVFPIGVNPIFQLERPGKRADWKAVDDFTPTFVKASAGKCPKFSTIGEMLGIGWKLPEKLRPGRYRVRARFCDKDLEEMPSEILTPEFEVVGR